MAPLVKITEFLIYMYILQLIVGFGYPLNQYKNVTHFTSI